MFSDSEPKPAPAPGRALVKIHAAGVNFVDIYQRRGTYPVKLPFIPGLEASGVVEAVGEGVEGFEPGDRVAYTGHLGSYSEYTSIDSSRLILLPKELSFVEGAAFPLQGMTAHYLIHDFREPKKGDTVLIHAAAGGVGLLLVQWAKHLGADVIGTVSTVEKAHLAKEAGADHVILYTREDFACETKRITKDRGANLILDGARAPSPPIWRPSPCAAISSYSGQRAAPRTRLRRTLWVQNRYPYQAELWGTLLRLGRIC
jgi:NADPH2:quinone reductase